MNLVTIAWKSIRQRALASFLTALSVALGVTLMVSVLVVHGIIERVFSQNKSGFHLVVGAKGSPLQLVLNTLYHLGNPVENIPYLYYKDLAKNPRVKYAIPICMGDVTREGNFRIIGTSPQFFEVDYYPGKKFRVRNPGHFLEGDFDAVIGYQVARANGWKIGTQFQPAHGVADDDHVHEEKFTVVGVLAPTGTPNDKGVFIHMDGFYQIAGHAKPEDEALAKAKAFEAFQQSQGKSGANGPAPAPPPEPPKTKEHDHAHDHGHDHHHHHDLPDEQKEVTAVLVFAKNDPSAIFLRADINEGPYAQAAIPFAEINWVINNVVGNIRTLLVVMTALILLVSGVGVFVSIYNSMADRRREIAIMRALGASRSNVFSIILMESILLCVGGGIFGILLGHGLVFFASPFIEAQSGLIIDPWAFEKMEIVLLPILIALASLVGIVPGATAYRTDVAKSLHA